MTPDQIQLFIDGLARLTRETGIELDNETGVSLRPRTSGNYAAEETPLGYRIRVLDADDDRGAVPKHFLRSLKSDDERFREAFERSRGRIGPDFVLIDDLEGLRDKGSPRAGNIPGPSEVVAEFSSDAQDHLRTETEVRIEVHLSDEHYAIAKQLVADGFAGSVDGVLRDALDLVVLTEKRRRWPSDKAD